MKTDRALDTLSAALMKIKLESSAVTAFEAQGKWAIEYPHYKCFKLHLLLRGEMWVAIEGRKEKYHLKAGDCLLMTGGQPFVNASDLSIKRRILIIDLVKTARNGVMTINGGGETLWIGTRFEFEGHLPSVIFAGLPPAIHISENLDESVALRWNLERFRAEFLESRPGRSLLLNSLALIILLQILRIYLSSPKAEKNWLVALSDERLSKALEAIHADYSKRWTLETLARKAGMSRSRFAVLFKRQIGLTPMEYLANWRMQIACELLGEGDQNITEVASAVGYESESAFSDAFKKIMKFRPSVYQRSFRNGSVR